MRRRSRVRPRIIARPRPARTPRHPRANAPQRGGGRRPGRQTPRASAEPANRVTLPQKLMSLLKNPTSRSEYYHPDGRAKPMNLAILHHRRDRNRRRRALVDGALRVMRDRFIYAWMLVAAVWL